MAKIIDGTKVPHTGSSTWKTRADFLSQSLLPQSERTNISQAASLWKMKKVKIGRAAAPPNRKLSKRGPACECRSVHAVGVSKACPLWVKSGHLQCKKVCPLYPQKRTFAADFGMSALCQKRTLPYSFDHLIGAGEQRRRHGEAERLGVLRLITSSYVVGAWTGISAGFSPLRMRST
jgi:hypothetical protein